MYGPTWQGVVACPRHKIEKNEHFKMLELCNRSPKGNMWSAIPVALLCMVVNWNERKQDSGPEGDVVL